MGREEIRGEPEATFEETLGKLIQLAQSSMSESKSQRRPAHAPSSGDGGSSDNGDPSHGGPATAAPSPQSSLRRTLESLRPDMALKVRTLMVAGRDGRDVGTVQLDPTLGDSEAAFATAARDASENGPLLADSLRRGDALACAAAIDLERPLPQWASKQAATLHERAWLSFGRQLASSEPDDWQFVGCVEPGGQQIIRLYVKLRDHAWWSFQSVLDRPSSASVSKETRALASRRTKGVMASSLKTLAGQLGAASSAARKGTATLSAKTASAQGRALQRAARAIRARVGQSGVTESTPERRARP